VLHVPEKLPDAEQQILARLLGQIGRYRRRNELRGDYVDSARRLRAVGFSIPEHMVDFQTPIGWPEKTVKVPAARIRPNGFTCRTDSSLKDEIDEIFEDNHLLSLERMAIEASLETGCAFIFAFRGTPAFGEGSVVASARTALEATCELDPFTGLVKSALELIDKASAKLYLPGVTYDLARDDNGAWVIAARHEKGHQLVPCVPYVWGRSLRSPLGRSRVTRPLMGFTDVGVRTLLRMEVTAEFFSAPQRALLGADESHFTDKDGKRISPLSAMTGGVWGLPDIFDEDEGKNIRAQLVQLQQASMQPHGDMMKTIGLMVSSETSMPVHYLGIVQDNPSSADAIRAAESDMVALVEYERDLSYKPARERLARLALAELHGEFTDSMAKDLRGLSAQFLDAGTPTLAARSDAVVKFRAAFPEAPVDMVAREYGMADDQIDLLADAARTQAARASLDALIAGSKTAPVVPALPAAPANGQTGG
jgi:hypothetical protein